MGFIKKLAMLTPIGLISKLASGDDKKEAPATIAQKTGTPEKTADQISEDKRKKIVAANAGASKSNNPLSNTNEDVTSKSLLGL